MQDGMTVISTEGHSSVEIAKNAKNEFTFVVKVYAGEVPETEQTKGMDPPGRAQKRAYELAIQCCKDIKVLITQL